MADTAVGPPYASGNWRIDDMSHWYRPRLAATPALRVLLSGLNARAKTGNPRLGNVASRRWLLSSHTRMTPFPSPDAAKRLSGLTVTEVTCAVPLPGKVPEYTLFSLLSRLLREPALCAVCQA